MPITLSPAISANTYIPITSITTNKTSLMSCNLIISLYYSIHLM